MSRGYPQPLPQSKPCAYCALPMTRRASETATAWRKRRTCGRSCAFRWQWDVLGSYDRRAVWQRERTKQGDPWTCECGAVVVGIACERCVERKELGR